MTFILLSKRVLGSPAFLEKIDWDVFGTPIVWGIVLLFHAISVFGKPVFFGRRWEQRKMEEFMSEQENRDL